MPDFLTPAGVIVPAGSLTLPRTRALAETAAFDQLHYVELVECFTNGTDPGLVETVVIDLRVERPQKPVNAIESTERVAVVFSAADKQFPEVLSLRPDFPWVPHLNLRVKEFPRSLCLYDRSWSEVAPRWTAAVFIERIRYWLAATARGELHQDDQPLEPLLLHHCTRLILPADFYAGLSEEKPVHLELFAAAPDCQTLIALRTRPKAKGGGLKFVGTIFITSPQTHGLIRRTPSNLAELHAFLLTGEIDLIGKLRERLLNWRASELLDASLAIIVALPVARTAGGDAEKWETWAFATLKTVRDIGSDIGLWDLHGKEVGLLIGADDSARGETIQIDILSPSLAFSRVGAAAANGIAPNAAKVVAIGAGALGSQVVTTLFRSGFGDWTVVDEDVLLPHNLSRHALHGEYVGYPKALGLAHFLNQIYGGAAKEIVADVLAPGEKADALNQAYTDAEMILDISASVPVARHLARDVTSTARRISIFLNPHGTDVVVLAEDKLRTLKLDNLEAQYYRAVDTDPALAGHLSDNLGKTRYGRSCRDITALMPTHLVTMLASLGSQAVRTALSSEDATIQIFRCDAATLAVKPLTVEPYLCVTQEINGWKLILDKKLLQTLADIRTSKLPNETGGVLIGSFDLPRRIIYAVDTVPSPPDSKEWPTLYVRGSEGLLARVEEITRLTGGQLEYIGEWHSHPDGCATRPSSDDLQVFVWLTEHMAIAGLPALMAIVGEKDSSSWYLGEMLSAGGWTVVK